MAIALAPDTEKGSVTLLTAGVSQGPHRCRVAARRLRALFACKGLKMLRPGSDGAGRDRCWASAHRCRCWIGGGLLGIGGGASLILEDVTRQSIAARADLSDVSAAQQSLQRRG